MSADDDLETVLGAGDGLVNKEFQSKCGHCHHRGKHRMLWDDMTREIRKSFFKRLMSEILGRCGNWARKRAGQAFQKRAFYGMLGNLKDSEEPIKRKGAA